MVIFNCGFMKVIFNDEYMVSSFKLLILNEKCNIYKNKF